MHPGKSQLGAKRIFYNYLNFMGSGIYDARSLGPGRMTVLGLQHLFAMFGTTVLVPVITGLSVSATLLFAGIGTLVSMAVCLIGKPKTKKRYEKSDNDCPQAA